MDERAEAEAVASMERVRRLAHLWSYLPAFRVVAELLHLPSAAKRLGTSASALSRAIRLLEDQVGVPLFVRAGRRLALSEHGRLLLDGTRDAMRLLDDALADVHGERLVGALRVATDAAVRARVLAAAAVLAREAPRLTVIERAAAGNEVAALLLRGELDVAVTLDDAPVPAGLVAVPLLELAFAPAMARSFVSERAAESARSFVSYPGDPWPAAWPRTVALRCADVGGAVVAARTSGLAAMLPLPVPEGFTVVDEGQTRRRAARAVMRRALRPGGAAERFVALLRDA